MTRPSTILRRTLGANLWRTRYRDNIARFLYNIGL